MKKNICVFTCITGDYDYLKNPELIEENIDYYCFTNNKKIKSDIWKMVYIKDDTLSDAILSRKIKLLGHDRINGKYDIYVWMDSCFKIIKSVNDFLNEYCDFSKHDYFAFKHHARNNIKEEMQACLFHGKETLKNVNKLKKFYEEEKYEYNNDLCENGIIIRNYNDTVQQTMKIWFDMLVNYSGRDQLSFNYVASKTKLNFSRIDLILYNNEYFKIYNHNNKKDKYSIYFKQKENDGINEYADGDKIYNVIGIHNDELKIDVMVPKMCKFIDINVSALSEYVIINTKIISNIKIKYTYINVYQYLNNVVSKNDDSVLRLSGNFKKDEKFSIILQLSSDKMSIIDNYINELNIQHARENEENSRKITELIDKYNYVNNLYNGIINSKRWKITDKVFKIIKK